MSKNESSNVIGNLLEGAEELLQRIADIDSADIQKLRAKARATLASARDAVNDGAAEVTRQAREVASATDGYVREYPWAAVGAAAILGFAAGTIIGSALSDGD